MNSQKWNSFIQNNAPRLAMRAAASNENSQKQIKDSMSPHLYNAQVGAKYAMRLCQPIMALKVAEGRITAAVLAGSV